MRSRRASIGIAAPSQVVAGDMVAHGKPDPSAISRGAALLSRRPEECLVIEDAPAGIREANAAGGKVLAVATSTVRKSCGRRDWIVARLDDIEVCIDETATLNLSFPALLRGTDSTP